MFIGFQPSHSRIELATKGTPMAVRKAYGAKSTSHDDDDDDDDDAGWNQDIRQPITYLKGSFPLEPAVSQLNSIHNSHTIYL